MRVPLSFFEWKGWKDGSLPGLRERLWIPLRTRDMLNLELLEDFLAVRYDVVATLAWLVGLR